MVRGKVLATIAIALVTVSCSKSPQQDLASGDKYFQKKQYSEASVEYRRALQKNPRYGEAHLRLAECYVALNDPNKALEHYIRASDELPKNIDAHLQAARFLLMAERFEDALARAVRALAVDEKNIDAHILKGNAQAGLKNLDGAIKEIEGALDFDRSGRAYTSLGAFRAAKGNMADAEEAFKKAVELNPKSVSARLALAQFYAGSRRPAEAEQQVNAALQVEPGNVMANRFAAAFYLLSNRQADAERPLRKIVETTKAPGASLSLADYYILTKRYDDAVRTLEKIAGEKGWYAPARSRIASIQYEQKRPAEAHATIDEVLRREPKNAVALLVKAQFLFAEDKLDAALDKAKASVDADRSSAPAHYMLGLVYRQRKDIDEAIKEFTEVVRLDSRASAAQLQLSQLHLARSATGQTGQPLDAAVQFAEQAVQASPDSPDAHLALARGLLARGDFQRAQSELKGLLARRPNETGLTEEQKGNLAQLHALMGTALLAGKDDAAARREFERTLQIDPKSYEGLAGLVQLDVKANKLLDARAKVESHLVQAQTDGPRAHGRLLMLSADLYLKQGDEARAEQTLQQAIQVAPDDLQAYASLASLYGQQASRVRDPAERQRKLDQARAGFEELARRQKKPVGALTMIATILQMQGKPAEAQKAYERVMKVDPRAPVASNNLAWLYVEQGLNLDMALQLAQTAKQALPDRPEVNDTLGWIYYKKKFPTMAVGLLELAAKARPDNALYQYHLGMAYVDDGKSVSGRRALEQALKLKPPLGAAEADAARRVLASLQ